MKKNITEFTEHFRKSVAQVAESLDLIDSTSNCQKRNGTIQLTDPIASTETYTVVYTMNESGWVVRRKLKAHGHRSATNRAFGHLLNEQIQSRSCKHYRVRAEKDEQLGLLVRGVVRYR
jgi:hypothetical protein